MCKQVHLSWSKDHKHIAGRLLSDAQSISFSRTDGAERPHFNDEQSRCHGCGVASSSANSSWWGRDYCKEAAIEVKAK